MPKGSWTTRTFADGTVQRRWTENELMELDSLLDAGLSDEAIALRLNRSVDAVKIKWTRMKFRCRRDRVLTARAVSRYMGWGCAKKTTRLISEGVLTGRKGQGVGRNFMWYVQEDALIEFLKDPRYWARWRVEDITHPDYRAWAQEIRTERYLTTRQVAEMHGVLHPTVQSWIEKGLLPAIRWANWQIREADAKAFVPPCERDRGGYKIKRWTRSDKAMLTRLKNQGMTFQQIADRMGRPIGSVANRWYRS